MGIFVGFTMRNIAVLTVFVLELVNASPLDFVKTNGTRRRARNFGEAANQLASASVAVFPTIPNRDLDNEGIRKAAKWVEKHQHIFDEANALMRSLKKHDTGSFLNVSIALRGKKSDELLRQEEPEVKTVDFLRNVVERYRNQTEAQKVTGHFGQRF